MSDWTQSSAKNLLEKYMAQQVNATQLEHILHKETQLLSHAYTLALYNATVEILENYIKTIQQKQENKQSQGIVTLVSLYMHSFFISFSWFSLNSKN